MMKTSNWTTQEIEARQDELADYFENLDPSTMTQTPVAEGYLKWAVDDLISAGPGADAERRALDQAATRALREGSSPERVAEIMGIAVTEVTARYPTALPVTPAS